MSLVAKIRIHSNPVEIHIHMICMLEISIWIASCQAVCEPNLSQAYVFGPCSLSTSGGARFFSQMTPGPVTGLAWTRDKGTGAQTGILEGHRGRILGWI